MANKEYKDNICYLKAMKTISREIILILIVLLGLLFFKICQFTRPLLSVPVDHDVVSATLK